MDLFSIRRKNEAPGFDPDGISKTDRDQRVKGKRKLKRDFVPEAAAMVRWAIAEMNRPTPGKTR
jgi:hypothetical protein